MDRLYLQDVPFESVSIKAESNEIRSTSTSGRTKVRKQFTYSRKEITATTTILKPNEAQELRELIEDKETTSSWIFTDPNPDSKLTLTPTATTNTSISFNPSKYRKDRFFIGQTLEIIKSNGSIEQADIQDIDLVSSRIIFTQPLSSYLDIDSVRGSINYRVTFIEVPTIEATGKMNFHYPAITLKMKEIIL